MSAAPTTSHASVHGLDRRRIVAIVLTWLPFLVFVIYALWMYRRTPAAIPTHWGDGNRLPDGVSSILSARILDGGITAVSAAFATAGIGCPSHTDNVLRIRETLVFVGAGISALGAASYIVGVQLTIATGGAPQALVHSASTNSDLFLLGSVLWGAVPFCVLFGDRVRQTLDYVWFSVTRSFRS